MSDASHELILNFESQELTKAFTDVAVHAVDLTERLSSPFALKADLLLEKPLTRAAIKSVLGARSRVTIRKKLLSASGSAYFAERHVCGVISRFRFEGIIYSAADEAARRTCARYTMTLTPKLAALADTRATRSFSGKTPPEVLVAVLSEYGFDGNLNQTLLNNTAWDTLAYFQQQEESDWAFITRLMLLYGINFNFLHSADFWEPQLCLTNSWVFEPKKQVASTLSGALLTVSAKVRYLGANGTPFEGPAGFDGIKLTAGLRGQTENVHVVLQNWTMEESAGLATFTVANTASSDATDPTTGKKRPAWSASGALNQYESRYGALPLIADRKRIAENLLAAEKLTHCTWRGATDSLSASPGTRLEVRDGFGDGENSDKLEALIVKTHLTVRDVWPDHLAFPPAEDLSGEPVTITLEAVECDAKEPTCASFAKQEAPDSKNALRPSFTPSPATLLIGKVRAGGSNVFDTAAPASSPEYASAVQVELASGSVIYAEVGLSAGSSASGLRYFPRSGDSVLVAGFGGRWFIVSYLPAAPLADTPSDLAELTRAIDCWQQGAQSNTESLWSAGAANRLSMTQKLSARNYVINLILTGRLEQFFRHYAISTRNEDYYHCTVSSSVNKTYAEIVATGIPASDDARSADARGKGLSETVKRYLAALQGVQDAALTQEQHYAAELESGSKIALRSAAQDAAKKELEQAWSGLCAIADYIAKNYLKGYTEEQPLMALQSEGNMVLSAGSNGNMSLTGEDISITGSAVNISTDKQIVLSSGSGIQLKVGGNSITMDVNGIILKSLRKMTTMGPFNSMIKLDSFSGVALTGISCTMNGTLRCAMGDAFGGGVAASNGSVSVSGLEVNTTAGSMTSVLRNFTQFVADITAELSSLSSNVNKANAETGIVITDFLLKYNTIGETISQLIQQHVNRKTTDNLGFPYALKWINSILTVAQINVDLALALLIANNSAYLKEDVGSGLNRRDALELASLVMKLTITLDTLVPVFFLLTKEGLFKKSTLSVRTGGVSIDAEKVQTIALKKETNISPLAGK